MDLSARRRAAPKPHDVAKRAQYRPHSQIFRLDGRNGHQGFRVFRGNMPFCLSAFLVKTALQQARKMKNLTHGDFLPGFAQLRRGDFVGGDVAKRQRGAEQLARHAFPHFSHTR